MPIITKIYHFCAAHKYGHENWPCAKNHQVFGKDADIHGHNYKLEISVTGPINEDTGFIIDLDILSEIVKNEVLDYMDHSQIEKDIDWFENRQPSTENMVIFIWQQLQSELPGKVKLVKIKLQETPTIYSEYFGPED